jgi:hypothetical protein
MNKEPDIARRVGLSALVTAVKSAEVEDRVRGVLALLFVVVLLLLLFFTPNDASSTAIASAKTLAISVIAFYFGLHGSTPHNPSKGRTKGRDE